MADKMWTRADVRAEMNRVVKGTTDACRVIHDAAAKIEALGKESGFEDDAARAVFELQKRAAPPKCAVTELHSGKPVPSPGDALRRATPLTPQSTVSEVKRALGYPDTRGGALHAGIQGQYSDSKLAKREVVPLMVQHGRDGYYSVENEVGCPTCAGKGIIGGGPARCRTCGGTGLVSAPAKSEVQCVLETWGAQGCTCDMQGFSVRTAVMHAKGCRAFQEHPPYARCASSISSAVALLPGCTQGIWISKRAGWDVSEATIVVQHQPSSAMPFFIRQGNHLNIWGVVGEAGLARLLVEYPDEKVLMVASTREESK